MSHEVQKENIYLLPLGRRANTIPLPPRAVTKNPALITDKTARPLALAITWAETAKLFIQNLVRVQGKGKINSAFNNFEHIEVK